MNLEVKTKWVAALRSGEYIQGKGILRKVVNNQTCHCVLGVLTDIYVKEEGMIWYEISSSYMLSNRVKDWAGISGADSMLVKIDSIRVPLIIHNDSYQASFIELADAIESQL